jgi:hypothetical protein
MAALGCEAEALGGACGRGMPATSPEEEQSQAAEEKFRNWDLQEKNRRRRGKKSWPI